MNQVEMLYCNHEWLNNLLFGLIRLRLLHGLQFCAGSSAHVHHHISETVPGGACRTAANARRARASTLFS